MWILIIIAVVICCIIAGISQSSEDAAEAESIRIANQIAAKRPDAFIRLFQEEFPNYAGTITFSKAEAAIREWERAADSKEYKRHLKMFNKGKFKNAHAAKTAMSYIVRCTASEISPEFLIYVDENPLEDSYMGIRRAIHSSNTLANE